MLLRAEPKKGFVIAGDKRISYGELAEAAGKLPPPSNVQLKDKKDWQLPGQTYQTARCKSKGQWAGFLWSGDVYFPGMLNSCSGAFTRFWRNRKII